eukprot:1750763-Rhodomonas_salina.1
MQIMITGPQEAAQDLDVVWDLDPITWDSDQIDHVGFGAGSRGTVITRGVAAVVRARNERDSYANTPSITHLVSVPARHVLAHCFRSVFLSRYFSARILLQLLELFLIEHGVDGGCYLARALVDRDVDVVVAHLRPLTPLCQDLPRPLAGFITATRDHRAVWTGNAEGGGRSKEGEGGRGRAREGGEEGS